jgi:asparagine synthase (glutamine-hydrolysing)
MCGICGVIGNPDERLIEEMLARIAHRGPDDQGIYIGEFTAGRAGLGHRRLSIIDLSPAGHEPMADSRGEIVLTYNGEIYNFKELRRDLEALGHAFRSETDAEVLIYAYRQWGYECLSRLNGMFAFAIWDKRNESLFLARDRLGIKPLYYADTPSGFAFASEIKALFAIPGLERNVDLAALDQFMSFLWSPDPRTMFRGIHKLPPAHYLVYRAGRAETVEYWDVKFEEDFSVSEAEWTERLREQIQRSTRAQMVSDVPLGAFLSGGLDSSSLVALMTAASDSRLVTYTFGFRSEDLKYDVVEDDVKFARIVGKEFQTDYNEELLQPEVTSLLPKLIYHMDEPVADPAILTSYLICKQARQRLTVLISGMGGDEVFAGYPRHLAHRLANIYGLAPRFLSHPLAAALPAGKPGKWKSTIRGIKKLDRSAALPPRERYLGFGTYFSATDKAQTYSDYLREAAEGFNAYEMHQVYFDRVAGQHFVNQMLYIDLKTFLPCLNLTYTDKTSMASSMEVRVPLLDHELIELMGKVPARLKLKGLTRKYIFKRAAEKWLPREIIHRRKAGFGAPMRAWLVNDLREAVEDLLSPTNIKTRGYFEYSSVRKLIDDNLSGREDNALKIFQLLTLELWHRTFIDAAPAAPPEATSVSFAGQGAVQR